ncbi:helix-turn-helix domain-containing protein [Bacillus dakarensis]|uniref:helix-turn-helix domain-containing protein n=1 Tax=Robertmurraya dakarensis TaxID=1926278 RepID=UPI0009819E2E|nr:helix-turn-helix domain-containing protein [Bacillus dakarensis]
MIGKNIYRIRKQRGLTLSELAERAAISKSYLSNIERSLNKNPSIQVLEKISGVLQVDLQLLLNPNADITEPTPSIDKEWLKLINELKERGVDKKTVQDYKILLEFIKWQQENKG